MSISSAELRTASLRMIVARHFDGALGDGKLGGNRLIRFPGANELQQAIINLALMTRNIGRPGTGANLITGRCNAMGSRLFSNTTNLLGGHDFNPIIEAIQWRDSGTVGGGHEPSSFVDQSEHDPRRPRASRFPVVRDMYHSTETAQQAHLVLPAAGWGEKDGTFFNLERRIGLTRKVRRAPGEALADFHIFKLIADYWGCGEMFASWEWPAAVFELLKQLTADQPCDVTGIAGYDALAESDGIQWPFPAERSERRLFEDGQFYHPHGRARFVAEAPRPLPELPNHKYPFLLLTGRGSAAQWHTKTRTAKSVTLGKLYANVLYIKINSQDAQRLGFRPGKTVRVAPQRGELHAKALLTPTAQPGQAFSPIHDEATNRLTDALFDPYSHQPAYESCAVSITHLE